ncbi:hypothetical protein C8T65DRAFT_748484 [Cerioporus squamosus]|nr:hypothetical protein C8T65DRAFT_748484 [Cerioporus squamosus]
MSPPISPLPASPPPNVSVFDVPSPDACLSAPPPTPRLMPVPEDIQDGVFRLPPVSELLELSQRGPMSFGGAAADARSLPGVTLMGDARSPLEYAEAYSPQASPSPHTAALMSAVRTNGGGTETNGYYVSQPTSGSRKPGAAGGAPGETIFYPRPNYGVLRRDAVARYATYRSPGSFSLGDPQLGATEAEGTLTREGLPTVLPLPRRDLSAALSTPGGTFAGMTIEGGRELWSAEGSGSEGLYLLADAAAYLARSHTQHDADTVMGREDGEVTPTRSGSPVAENPGQSNDVAHRDRPVPGVVMTPEEFMCQQQGLIALQLAHDEARALSTTLRHPRAQFYSTIPPRAPSIDPVLLMGYAPMEVDGFPGQREPLAHAHVSGSDSSEHDLYLPPPLEDNLRDDPPDAPRVPHTYDGLEVAGPTLRSGEVRYSHDIPIRNSAALSAGISGASANIPEVWHSGDHVADARHLAGGHAAPPQHILMPPTIPLISFTIIPLSGAPPFHCDDPEFLIKGLASERVHVMFRQPQGTIILVKIFNSGIPRANTVKLQSDALAEAVTAATGAKNFIIVPPAQAWGQELSLQDQPTTWIVLRLHPDHARALVSQRVWSSRKISFLAFNRDLRFDRFIGRVGYYTHNTDDDIGTSIRKAFGGPLILPSIQSLLASHPDIIPEAVDPVVERVLASLRVAVYTYPNGNIIANVYCDSPTHSVESWRLWIAYVHTIPMWSDLNPTGSFLRHVRCAGCSASDHPTFMCPFALIPGWNGPTPGAATIEGPTIATLVGALAAGRGFAAQGLHPYRGNSSRGRRGRGRGSPPF